MKCPKCDGTLIIEEYEGVEVDKCDSCSGVWLDIGEMSRIVEMEEETFSKEMIQSTLKESFSGVPLVERNLELACPRCNKTMDTANYNYSSGVVIDKCRDHGIWLDKNELEKVQIIRESSRKKTKGRLVEIKEIMDDVKENMPVSDPNIGPSSFKFMNRVINFLVRTF